MTLLSGRSHAAPNVAEADGGRSGSVTGAWAVGATRTDAAAFAVAARLAARAEGGGSPGGGGGFQPSYGQTRGSSLALATFSSA